MIRLFNWFKVRFLDFNMPGGRGKIRPPSEWPVARDGACKYVISVGLGWAGAPGRITWSSWKTAKGYISMSRPQPGPMPKSWKNTG